MRVHNNAKSCNANRFLGRSTGSAGGTVGAYEISNRTFFLINIALHLGQKNRELHN